MNLTDSIIQKCFNFTILDELEIGTPFRLLPYENIYSLDQLPNTPVYVEAWFGGKGM